MSFIVLCFWRNSDKCLNIKCGHPVDKFNSLIFWKQVFSGQNQVKIPVLLFGFFCAVFSWRKVPSLHRKLFEKRNYSGCFIYRKKGSKEPNEIFLKKVEKKIFFWTLNSLYLCWNVIEAPFFPGFIAKIASFLVW